MKLIAFVEFVGFIVFIVFVVCIELKGQACQLIADSKKMEGDKMRG
jgi:hypothetical protein